MCGIAGTLSWESPPEIAIVKAMTDEMARRGPDAEGFYHNGPIAFGHRRLSIIDLSENGRQPMADHSGAYWIVFNGEIYNFQELRGELIKFGATFRSTSDTEIILEAYKAWGNECLKRFNGMFAFALWDTNAKRLLLARDRVGKKPLYYYQFPDGGISFASELKALLRDPRIERKVNSRALSEYLSLSYVLTDSCIVEGVQKLEPAHFMTVERGRTSSPLRYWDLASFFRKKVSVTEDEAAEELQRLLLDATRLRMISDVPLGAFLSGGLDSSAIVAAMCKIQDPALVNTFSIGFQEKTYSELPEAARVAKYLGVTHYDKIVTPRMAESFSTLAYLADEPFADNSMIPVYYLSGFAREKVTVALSGDGGDEIFSGYETFSATKMHRAFHRMPSALRKIIAKSVDALMPVTHNKVSTDYKLRKFLAAESLSWQEAHYSWRTIFTQTEKAALLRTSYKDASSYSPFERSAKFFEEVSDCHYLDQSMYVDIKTWLPDDILVKADRMSMAQSLELRCPLLDHRLIEFAASLPPEMKMKGLTKKYIFKKSQEKILPHDTIYRKKSGFNAPVAHWINSSLRNMVEESTRDTPLSEICNPDYTSRLLTQHESLKADNSFQLFNLMSLGLWLKSNHEGAHQALKAAS